MEHENEFYAILKIFNNQEQVIMYNAQCDIISKKQIHCLLDYLTLIKTQFLFFLAPIKLTSY